MNEGWGGLGFIFGVRNHPPSVASMAATFQRLYEESSWGERYSEVHLPRDLCSRRASSSKLRDHLQLQLLV